MRGNFQEITKVRSYFSTGMFMLLFGAFFGGIPLLIIFNAPDVPVFVYLFPTIGLVMFLAGLRFMFTQNGLDADQDDEVLRVWHRFAFKQSEELIPFDKLNLVDMSIKVIRTRNSNGSSSSKTVYPVVIYQKSGDTINVATCPTSVKARAQAERVSEMLKIKLQDSTSGQTVVRDHDKLDETVGARLLREKAEIELASPPDGSDITFDTTDSKGVISLPKTGTMGMIPAFVLLVFGGVFLAIVAAVSEGGERPIILLIMGGPIFLISATIIWNALFPRKVEIDSEYLLVRQDGTLGRTLGKIRVSELEELYAMGNRVLCRGDRGDVSFVLAEDSHAKWVKQVLEYILLQMEKGKA